MGDTKGLLLTVLRGVATRKLGFKKQFTCKVNVNALRALNMASLQYGKSFMRKPWAPLLFRL